MNWTTADFHFLAGTDRKNSYGFQHAIFDAGRLVRFQRYNTSREDCTLSQSDNKIRKENRVLELSPTSDDIRGWLCNYRTVQKNKNLISTHCTGSKLHTTQATLALFSDLWSI